ncbi:unnamed protein product, partial [Prunus brigantina]
HCINRDAHCSYHKSTHTKKKQNLFFFFLQACKTLNKIILIKTKLTQLNSTTICME